MIEKALAWFYARKGRVSYSMERRNGPSSYDCSSSVYYALKEAGILPSSYWIGNTDTLFDALEKNGWVRVPTDANGDAQCQRGDIFIWGIRGNSGGALGHTGMFVDADNVINCRYQAGIVIDNHDWLWSASGRPPYAFYRYVGKPAPAPQQRIALPEVYYADEVATVFNIRQIRCNRLTHAFDWEDNGIPTAIALRVDRDGYAIGGEVNTGDYFRVLGRMDVLAEEVDNGHKYLQVRMGDESVWVLAERTRALRDSDQGTPHPGARPEPQPAPNTPAPAPQPEQPKPEPKQPEVPEQPVPTPKPEEQPQEKPLAPQPSIDDILRGLGIGEKTMGAFKKLLHSIIEFITNLFKKK